MTNPKYVEGQQLNLNRGQGAIVKVLGSQSVTINDNNGLPFQAHIYLVETARGKLKMVEQSLLSNRS